jgi:hypothetical protein
MRGFIRHGGRLRRARAVMAGALFALPGLLGVTGFVAPAAAVDEVPHIAPGTPGTVTGTVLLDTGAPASGALVELELLSSHPAAYAQSTVAHIVATGRTTSTGVFVIPIPVTPDVLAETRYHNGRGQFDVSATKNLVTGTAHGVRNRVVGGAGGFTATLTEGGTNTSALVFGALNLGYMTIGDATSPGSIGLHSETPYEYTPAADVDNARPRGIPGVSMYIPDQSASDVAIPYDPTAADPAPWIAETPSTRNPDDTSGGGWADICKHTDNQERWHTKRLDREYRWHPVGEVHSSTDEKVYYTYGQAAHTKIGTSYNQSGKGWKVNGGFTIGTSRGTEAKMATQRPSFSRHVMAEFFHVKEAMMRCPQGYDEERGPWPLFKDRIRAISWQGTLQYDSRDISGRDTKDEYERAFDEGRAGHMERGGTFIKNAGKSFKWEAGVTAFGVQIFAESYHDTTHKMTLKAGRSRMEYKIMGSHAAPPDPSNVTVYAWN